MTSKGSKDGVVFVELRCRDEARCPLECSGESVSFVLAVKES